MSPSDIYHHEAAQARIRGASIPPTRSAFGRMERERRRREWDAEKERRKHTQTDMSSQTWNRRREDLSVLSEMGTSGDGIRRPLATRHGSLGIPNASGLICIEATPVFGESEETNELVDDRFMN